jgi:hypothetical protein
MVKFIYYYTYILKHYSTNNVITKHITVQWRKGLVMS